jgi:hypothetical protein
MARGRRPRTAQHGAGRQEHGRCKMHLLGPCNRIALRSGRTEEIDGAFIREHLRRSVPTARYTEFLNADGTTGGMHGSRGLSEEQAQEGEVGPLTTHANQRLIDERPCHLPSGRHRDAGVRRATCMQVHVCLHIRSSAPPLLFLPSHAQSAAACSRR